MHYWCVHYTPRTSTLVLLLVLVWMCNDRDKISGWIFTSLACENSGDSPFPCPLIIAVDNHYFKQHSEWTSLANSLIHLSPISRIWVIKLSWQRRLVYFTISLILSIIDSYGLLHMMVEKIRREQRRGLILREFCIIFLYVLSALILKTIQWNAYCYCHFYRGR